jgi:hypothetical protein
MFVLLIAAVVANVVLVPLIADRLSPTSNVQVRGVEHIADLWLTA